MKNSPIPLVIIVVLIAAIATVEKNDGDITNPFEDDNAAEYTNEYYYPEDDTRQEEPSTNAPATQKLESAYSAYISIGGFRDSRYEGAPGDEKITISLSSRAPAPVNITGWQIWSVATGNRATIGEGVYTYRDSGNNTLVPIILTPGQRAIVYSGTSPFGNSFIPNICMAYFSDVRDFPYGFPSRCPDPEEKAFPLPFFDRRNECRDYIETMPECAVPYYDEDFGPGISNECQAYVKDLTGYDNCVRLWQNDEDFYKKEWWVYLGKPARMYGDRDEQVLLFDERGILIDSY